MADYGKILSNTFTLWYKDSGTLKLIGIYFIVTMLLWALMLGAVVVFFGSALTSYMNLAGQYNGMPAPPQEVLMPLLASVLANIIPFILVMLPLFIIYALAISYLQVLMSVRSLDALGMRPAPMNFSKFLRFIVYMIWISIAEITSWYNRPFLIAFIALVLLLFVSIAAVFVNQLIGGILFIGWLLPFFAYVIVMIYNGIRLYLSPIPFLLKDVSIAEAGRESWEMSKGKVLDIFVITLVLGILLAVVYLALYLPVLVLEFVIFAIAGNSLLPQAIETLFGIVITPFLVAISTYALSSIYLALFGGASLSGTAEGDPAPKPRFSAK